MRSLMFLLVLVLFCFVPMTSSAIKSINEARSTCCGEFTKVKVPVKLVKSFYWTSSSCPIRAIVFQTIKGKEFCVDPEAAWVNGHVAKVDRRTTSAATTSSPTTTTSAATNTPTTSTTTTTNTPTTSSTRTTTTNTPTTSSTTSSAATNTPKTSTATTAKTASAASTTTTAKTQSSTVSRNSTVPV